MELAHNDPLNAWDDTPALELSGPLGSRLEAVLADLPSIRT
jgi:hypothetical protein